MSKTEMAEGEELGSNLLRLARRASASKPMATSPKTKKGDFNVGHSDCPLQIPSASEMLSNPLGLYVHALDCASNRVVDGAL